MTDNKSCEVELAWSSAHWARTYGTSRDNRGYDVVATTDGGYIAVGYSSDDARLHDGVIVKVDAAGAPLWQHRYSTVNKDELEGIVELAGGGYVVVGRTFATGRDMDALILRLDASGQILGQTTFGSAGQEMIHDIAVTSATTAVVVGEHVDSSSGLVLGIDLTTGAVQWSKLLKVGTYSQLDGVTTLANGNVVAVGVNSTGAWLLELTSTGTVVRERTVGTNASFTAVVRQGTGWIAGGSLQRPSSIYSDGWLVAFDATGAITWQRTYNRAEKLHDITPVAAGFVVAGQTQYDQVGDSVSGYLLGIDGIGGVRFERQYGSPSVTTSSYLLGVATGSGDRVIGAGYSSAFGAGSWDVLLTSVDAMGAIGTATCPVSFATSLTSTVGTPTASTTTTTATQTALTSPVSATGAATLLPLGGSIASACFD
ncbi:MAG: hypothetical protein SFX73_28120 [Kofleriaceae bacterium]|nr:hypothetical protein [Kofleriaceae bacterium]